MDSYSLDSQDIIGTQFLRDVSDDEGEQEDIIERIHKQNINDGDGDGSSDDLPRSSKFGGLNLLNVGGGLGSGGGSGLGGGLSSIGGGLGSGISDEIPKSSKFGGLGGLSGGGGGLGSKFGNFGLGNIHEDVEDDDVSEDVERENIFSGLGAGTSNKRKGLLSGVDSTNLAGLSTGKSKGINKFGGLSGLSGDPPKGTSKFGSLGGLSSRDIGGSKFGGLNMLESQAGANVHRTDFFGGIGNTGGILPRSSAGSATLEKQSKKVQQKIQTYTTPSITQQTFKTPLETEDMKLYISKQAKILDQQTDILKDLAKTVGSISSVVQGLKYTQSSENTGVDSVKKSLNSLLSGIDSVILSNKKTAYLIIPGYHGDENLTSKSASNKLDDKQVRVFGSVKGLSSILSPNAGSSSSEE